VVNTPERVEIPKKTTQAPSVVMRGRVAQTKKDNTPNNHPRTEKMRPLQKTVILNQLVVDRHNVDITQSSTKTCYRKDSASTLKNHDALVLGNTGIQKSLTILVPQKCMIIVL
jgi:hypothetical protein